MLGGRLSWRQCVNIVTNSSLCSSRSPSQNDGDDEGSEPPSPVIPVDPDACVLPDTTLRAFTVLDTVLVTLAQGPAHWKVQLFRCPCPGQDPRPRGQIGEVDLSTCTPLEIPGEPKASVFLPVLCCVLPPGSRVPHGHPRRTGGFTLEGSLFGLLFGADAALLESPVLLVGLPSGQLSCVVLKTLGTSGLAPSDPKATVKILHHLEEPVIFIGALRTEPLAEDMEDMYSDCLVALGHHGRTLAIKARRDEAGSLEPVLREYCLPGPVLCAACGGDGRVYHSTPSSLCVLDLAQAGAPWDPVQPSAGPGSLPSMPCPASLRVCSVLTLSVSSGMPEGTSRCLNVKSRSLGMVGTPCSGCLLPASALCPVSLLGRPFLSWPSPVVDSPRLGSGSASLCPVWVWEQARHSAWMGCAPSDPGLKHLSVTGLRSQVVQGRFRVRQGKLLPSYRRPENASPLTTWSATQPAPHHTVPYRSQSRLCVRLPWGVEPPAPRAYSCEDGRLPTNDGRPAIDSSQCEIKALKGKTTAHCRRPWVREGPGPRAAPRAAGLPLPAQPPWC